jgi:hypothetical protein
MFSPRISDRLSTIFLLADARVETKPGKTGQGTNA